MAVHALIQFVQAGQGPFTAGQAALGVDGTLVVVSNANDAQFGSTFSLGSSIADGNHQGVFTAEPTSTADFAARFDDSGAQNDGTTYNFASNTSAHVITSIYDGWGRCSSRRGP